MRSFDEILEISAARKGGRAAVLDRIQPPKTVGQLAAITDDRWLSAMTRGVFQAGFNWKVVANMWPGFEAAFKQFDVGKCAMMDDVWFDALITDRSIVRHGTKIRSVIDNAVFVGETSRAHGGFGAFVGGWPGDDFIGLLAVLKSDGARLGGATGQYFLRSMGRDGFILSRDVVARLVAEGVVDKTPTSKGAMRATQDAFNVWADQSGLSMTTISRVLAMSTG
ncbi:MAG: DNA-3-methyladenine glycosylase I [Paracoccaceae bacterium]